MPATYNNWVYDNKTVNEKDRNVLERAKKQERKNEKNGYRWIRIDARNKLFVPCDKNGTPTKDGRRMIRNFKNYMGIK